MIFYIHINELQQESIVDILYRTTIAGATGYLYFLIKHQSTPDKLMPFRLLKYTCNIIDQHLKETDSTAIPLVYPFVIYHAKRPYPFSNNIQDLVDAPKALVEQFFLKPFHLIDLGSISDEVLREHAWAGIMEWALKHIFDRDVLPTLRGMTALFRDIYQSGGKKYVGVVLEYLLTQAALSSKDDFIELVNTEISLTAGETIMTFEQMCKEEGMQQGMQQGTQQGIQQSTKSIAQRLLLSGMDVAFIAEVTGLSLGEIQLLGLVEVSFFGHCITALLPASFVLQ